MAYLSVPKISRHLIFLHLSSPFIVDNCSYISILSFAITYRMFSIKTMITVSFYLIDLLFIQTTALFCLFYICPDEWDDSVFLCRYALGSIPYFF